MRRSNKFLRKFAGANIMGTSARRLMAKLRTGDVEVQARIEIRFTRGEENER